MTGCSKSRKEPVQFGTGEQTTPPKQRQMLGKGYIVYENGRQTIWKKIRRLTRLRVFLK